MKTYMKNRIQCKCGKFFMNRKALGSHIKAQKKQIDISALHSAQKEERHGTQRVRIEISEEKAA